jgi:protein ImuB
MRVVCALLQPPERLQSLAEACLAFSPQIAVSREAVFVEIEASCRLFDASECIQRLKEMLELLEVSARIGVAPTVPEALAFARYGIDSLDALPVEALSDFLQPFAPVPLEGVEAFRKLGVLTLGDFKKIPRAEIPSRFGKQGLLAYERLLEAARVAWPRWAPAEKIEERADFDCAAQIPTFEPVLFLLKAAIQRVFLRLYARRKKLAAFTVTFHLNKFSSVPARVNTITLPLPQSEPKDVTKLAAERLSKELELRPLQDALEGLSVRVDDTAPFVNTQRDFFAKREEESLAWAALVGQLAERLGRDKTFLAVPAPRQRPESSWTKTLDEKERGTVVPAPLRPLRLFDPPRRLQRVGDTLVAHDGHWRFTGFRGPEKLRGEWWLGGFEREYFHVDTENGETLWVFTAAVKDDGPRGLWLHGVFD